MRRELRAARSRFAASVGDEPRDAIQRRLRRLIEDMGHPASLIAGYVAHRGEPDMSALLEWAHARGHGVALPRVDRDGIMAFVAWNPGEALVVGHAGILQPASEREVVPAILLVPLVGFDRAGRRLGQGGGFYDRWLAAHEAVRRIGVAWSVQEVAAVPTDDWDMPLDDVVTEKEWIAR